MMINFAFVVHYKLIVIIIIVAINAEYLIYDKGHSEILHSLLVYPQNNDKR